MKLYEEGKSLSTKFFVVEVGASLGVRSEFISLIANTQAATNFQAISTNQRTLSDYRCCLREFLSTNDWSNEEIGEHTA
jgi:hypothetical protein